MVYLSGKAASGAFLLKHNVLKSDKRTIQESLIEEKKKEESSRQVLFQRNVYKIPKIFHESKFDTDVEG